MGFICSPVSTEPPEKVSLSVVNHTGPLLEGQRYTLRCDVHDVAPVENLTVTFYKGRTAFSTLQTKNCAATPVSEVFTLTIRPHRDDDGVQYWCEAALKLGPDGPRHPPVVTSEKMTAVVLCEWAQLHTRGKLRRAALTPPFASPVGPQLVCPTKLQVREGERLSCEVRGNPPPVVTWFRNGEPVVLPAHSSREHAGTYTALARGPLERKNFTVEVEIVGGHGGAEASFHSSARQESFCSSSFFLFRKRKQLPQTFPATRGARAHGELDVTPPPREGPTCSFSHPPGRTDVAALSSILLHASFDAARFS